MVTQGSTRSMFGRYQMLGELGRGSMGQVFRAYDTQTDRVVAIKVLPSNMASDQEFQQRFRREARIAASLNDPHVVPIHSFGEINGRLYVDMRLVEGRDLDRFIGESGGRLRPEQAVAVVEQVAAALESAHKAGLVHRDVKPSNILVAAARDFVYLIDFGIARAAADPGITNTGHTMGTMAYMAPERFSGTTDSLTDVYSLACVLYQCLTGSKPYPGDSMEQQIAGHLSFPPPRPSVTVRDVPPLFDAVIARGMAKDPRARYQTVTELADAARGALPNPAAVNVPRPPSRAEAHTQLSPAQSAPPAPPPSQVSDVPTRAAAAVREEPAKAPVKAKPKRRKLVLASVAASVLALMLVAVLVVVFVNTGNKPGASAPSGATTATGTETVTETTSSAPGSVPALPPFVAPANLGSDCQYPPMSETAGKPVTPPRGGKISTSPAEIHATIATSDGDIGLRLANDKSPCTVNSFTSLARQGYFDQTHCHRLTTAQTLRVLQCGDPNGDGSGFPGYEFLNEYPTNQYKADDPALGQPVVYPRGTLATANYAVNTNGSQFFLVYGDSDLPPDYTVFGTIDAGGLAVVDKIAKGGVDGGGDDGAPVTAVNITSVQIR